MGFVCSSLPAVNRLYMLIVRHFYIVYRAVKYTFKPLLKPHGFKQHRIPNRIVACGITVHIVKHQFLKYTCFAAVSSPRSHRPHSYFRRTVTAKYRSVVYKNDAAAPACGGNFGSRRCSPILFCFLLYKLPQEPPKRL